MQKLKAGPEAVSPPRLGPPLGTGGRRDLHQQGAAGPKEKGFSGGRRASRETLLPGALSGTGPPTGCHPLGDAHPNVAVKKSGSRSEFRV